MNAKIEVQETSFARKYFWVGALAETHDILQSDFNRKELDRLWLSEDSSSNIDQRVGSALSW